MAEFCEDCWKEINQYNDIMCKYSLSKECEICEGCGEYKRVVVVKRRLKFSRRIKVSFELFKQHYYVFRIRLRNLCSKND